MKRLILIFLLVFSAGAEAETIEWGGGTYTGDIVSGVPHGQGTHIKAHQQPLRILFVGNSYTSQSWSAIVDVLVGHHLEGYVRGGAKLTDWAKDAKLSEKIKTGNWDYVVLQGQSQAPTLPGRLAKGFHESSAILDGRIRAAGGTTAFFMTWGRRDGDNQNKGINPTFEKMQARLSGSYRDAAMALKTKLVPVGEVFAAIKQEHSRMFPKLYMGDGSHPDRLGAYAVAYSIGWAILAIDPVTHARKKGSDFAKVAAVVKKAMGAGRVYREKYVGEWKNGKRNGQGTLTSSDGNKYVGEWKQDNPWEGTRYDKAGKVVASYSEGVEKLIN